VTWSLPLADRYFAPILAKDPRGFEIDHLELALSHCRSFRLAIDGGAHIGTWTVAMARYFNQVLAFEPAIDTHACLEANVSARKLDNVTIIRAALGAEVGKGRLIDDLKRIGNTGARHLDRESGGDLQIVPIDAMGLKSVDFIKLDLEGYEFWGLRGARETLARCRPVVMIEVKNFGTQRFGVTHDAAIGFLKREGFREVLTAKEDRDVLRNDHVFKPEEFCD
jgi:FkbM family methyltransferase